MRRRAPPAATALILLLLLPACGQQQPTAVTPWCDNFGILMLEAQSLPSAQFVPCLEGLPLGWDAGNTYVDNGGARFTLDSDIAGKGAVEVELVEECDVTEFARVPSDEAGTERYEFVERVTGGFRGERAYVFEGGCLTIKVRFVEGAVATLVNQLSVALSLMPRSAINDAVASVTGGREQLDPPGGD